MPLHILSPSSSLLPNFAGSLSLLAIAAGATSLINPRVGLEAFGFRPIADRDGMVLAEAAMQVYGVRNMGMGIANLIIWWAQHTSTGSTKHTLRGLMGALLLSGAATPIVDGYAAHRQGRTNPWNHWAFAPITILLGAGLISSSNWV